MNARQAAGFLSLGILVGGAAMNVIHGRQFETLNMQIQSLKMHYDEVERENTQLSAQLHQPNPEPLVQSIQVDAKAPDGPAQLQVIQFVQQQLQFLEGRHIQILIDSPELPTHLLEGRTVLVDNQELTIHVTSTMIVGETLYVHVSASSRPHG